MYPMNFTKLSTLIQQEQEQAVAKYTKDAAVVHGLELHEDIFGYQVVP